MGGLPYHHQWRGKYLKYGPNLAAQRTFNIFQDECLIVREISGKYPRSIIGSFSPYSEIYLFNLSNIAIIPRDKSNINLKYLLAIISSKLMSYYFMHTTPKAVRKMFPKIILKDLRKFPIKNISINEQEVFIRMTDYMLNKNKEFFDISTNFINLLKAEFSLAKLTSKLENWYYLNSDDFLKELVRNKVVLSLSQKAQWLDYFESQKANMLEVQKLIEHTDEKIDQAVYELYGLTSDEMKLIENPS